ncbi:tyrosine-type recombinase/integrase [Pelagerythrobacter marinus]|uniref:tyrosine-type recombinase/integrase n=1 Tax=Pelagerythrobacter marinus TaxID=538382 RepID=UPI002AC99DF1|nr:tyrosine-type recombinase/integrase [Pelagerythrobacter marinus]WPZ05530.1 tyrosine-type recombinase/integrase [Pelagerythrobacter marinus]
MHKLHIVRKRRKAGFRYYVYAWRGGPRIHTQDIDEPVIDTALLDKAAKARAQAANGWERTFDAIIDDYRHSPAFERLADSTKRDYRRWLDRISERFGACRIGAFEDRRMRKDIINWRNTWAHQPRSADKAAVTMATLLGWAVDQSDLSINVAARIPTLHRVNKADQIWERRHMRAMTRAPAHLRNALKMAGLTGLRLGDLVRLDWSQVGPTAIIVEQTRKRKSRAVIPILPETRKLLDKLEGREGPILRNSRGEPWTDSGLGSVFQKSKPAWFDRTIHDLRGTFATRLIMAGLTDDQAAYIMGWTAKRVGAIRARYVDEERVIISLAERLSA